VSLLGEAIDLLRKYGDVIGIKWSDPPGPLDRQLANSEAMGAIANLAESPIIMAAQLAIYGMKVTTGSGEPETGEAFVTSEKKYRDAAGLLEKTEIDDPAQWDGTAATAYQEKASEHRHQAYEVAEGDKEMRPLLLALGQKVKETRDGLQGSIDFLADYDTATSWMNSIPGGAVPKAIADAGVASTQLSMAQVSMAALVAESYDKAEKIRAVASRYQGASAQQLFGEQTDDQGRPVVLPCGEPFGDERTNGTLPTRTDPDTSYKPPFNPEPPVLKPK
jgi:ESX secretion-associated protein EspA/E